MTSTEYAALKMTIPGRVPFASSAQSSSATEPGMIVPGATTGSYSMPDGFDPTFDAAPTTTGSNMVQRGQINYIGKMASYAPFLGQTGGNYWGFDPAVCVAIGGYPKGSILTLVNGNSYLKVISLQDNNKVDFTGSTDLTNPSYSGVITNGTVDGVNWQYLNLDPQTYLDQSVVAEISPMEILYLQTQVLGVFKPYNNSALVVSGGLNFEHEEGHWAYSLQLIVSKAYNSLVELKNDAWTPLVPGSTATPNGTVIFALGNNETDSVAMVVEAGKYYAIGFYGWSQSAGPGSGESEAKPLKIKESTLTVKMKVL